MKKIIFVMLFIFSCGCFGVVNYAAEQDGANHTNTEHTAEKDGNEEENDTEKGFDPLEALQNIVPVLCGIFVVHRYLTEGEGKILRKKKFIK